jgi:hypothetical protein
MDFLKGIFKGTNGTLHAVLLIILGVSLLFKFPGNELVALVTGIIAFVGLVREWLKDKPKFGWDSNAVAYIVAGLAAVFPHLAKLFDAAADLVEAILSGNINIIISALVVFASILMQQFGKKESPQAEPGRGR